MVNRMSMAMKRPRGESRSRGDRRHGGSDLPVRATDVFGRDEGFVRGAGLSAAREDWVTGAGK